MAEQEDGGQDDRSVSNAPNYANKLSHKQFRRLVKKERRRKKRQEAAKRREEEELERKWRLKNDPVFRAMEEAKEKVEQRRLQEEEKERQVQHHLWLEREVIAQERFRKKMMDEERKLREKIEQEERIKKEWEEEQRKEKEKEERKQKEIKEKEEALFRELDKPATPFEKNESWHNPLAPSADLKSYGTEQDTVNCSFYLKTGACRFGERCSRHHPRPSSSVTLLIPGMYNDIRLSQSMLDEADHDTSLEYDEKEAYENFKQFYEDTLPEFKKAGSVVQFKVCCNHEPHLRGNVYVQFSSEGECARAFAMFNARWYASRQLSCEFSPVTKWKAAICGLFERNRCPRGKNCNFLHVYRNPGNEFRVRDDISPGGTPYNDRGSERFYRGWRREHWSRDRELRRDASRDRGWTHDRRRESNREECAHARYRDREDRGRSRRYEDEGRTSEREERRERSRKTVHSSDEHMEESVRLSPEDDRENKDRVNGSEHVPSPHSIQNKRKRKHHPSEKHSHRRKSKKKHKHHSKHKKKNKRNKSSCDSNSSDTEES